MSDPIRVLIADDQRIVREGLTLLLGHLPGIEVVGAVADGEAVLACVETSVPDIVLMDLRMPHCDGVEATKRLKARGPQPRVIALTTYADDRSLVDVLRAGARGFLTKDAGPEEILAAIRAVAGGEAAIDPAVQRQLIDLIAQDAAPETPMSPPTYPDALTAREVEVLALIAAGRSNAEIGQRLYVTEATVKSHVNHIFAKIGARDRAQAVAYAYQHGLDRPS